MTTELCRVTTEDGLRLEGLVQSPDRSPSDRAFLLVHGTGSNFYAPGVLEVFATQCVNAGATALRVNTRGHDLVCSIGAKKGSVRGGAAFEDVAEAGSDLAAWIRFLVQRGHPSIVLVGHSMGGVKSLLAMSDGAFTKEPFARHVAAVIGISPPRFRHANFQSHPAAEPFRRDFARALVTVNSGEPEALIEVAQPLPLLITAGGFVKKYGLEDQFDYVPRLRQLACPALVLVGTESMKTSPAFVGLVDAIGAEKASGVSTEAVEGANITYSSCPEEPFRRGREWLRERSQMAGAGPTR